MKTLILCLLCLCLALGGGRAEEALNDPEAAEGELSTESTMRISGSFHYQDYIDDTVKIIALSAQAGTEPLVIPETIDGRYVAALGENLSTLAIESVSIPKSVVVIEGNPFPAALKITVEEGSPHYMVEDGILYNRAKTRLFHYPRHREDLEFAVPEGVEMIAAGAISGNPYLQEILLPQSLTVLERRALADDPSLRSVQFLEGLVQIRAFALTGTSIVELNLPHSLRRIGAGAFWKTPLTQVSLPEGLTGIGDQAFSGTQLRSLSLPKSLQSLGKGAFQYCAALESVSLQEGLQSIDDAAFASTALHMVTLPASLDHIGENPFSGCTSLEHIYVYPDSLAQEFCRDLGLAYELLPNRPTEEIPQEPTEEPAEQPLEGGVM